jgi:FkbM family methyltransferase
MLEAVLNEYIFDTENPEKNYRLGLEYEMIGQTASALSYYLRAAERTENKNLAYECLIRMGNCFNSQKNRKFSVKSMYHAAIALLPERPEAYYYLSRFLEQDLHYFESYTTCEIALNISEGKTFEPLHVYYPGKYALLFQKATSAWWRGKGKESRQLYQQLVDDYWNVMDEPHKESVEGNILKLGSTPPSYIYRMYDPKMHSKLRYKFPGSEKITQNYSQIYQDIFVLSLLNGKREGTFVEIGGAGPHQGNNTYLLEKDFAWKGISVEYDENQVKEYLAVRPTVVYHADALTLDYETIIKNVLKTDVVDYLQLDIEPAGNTYECLRRIPFDKIKFRVITYEHDYYADMTRSYRDKSREYLKSKGYVLVANDLSPDGVCTFEDWWVHPDLVSHDILFQMRDIDPNNVAKDATQYMFSFKEKEFDWGLIENNQWFRNLVEEEVFTNDIYQKYVQIKEGDVVLDVGASVGPFAWKIKDNKPSKVICLEPHKGLFQTLKKNITYDGTVCLNKAIGKTDGIELQSGLFNENTIYTQTEGNIQPVESITFKTLLEQNNITHINFMKLDCEGGEYEILNDENIDWIKVNVDYITGEWHLSSEETKKAFVHFRDNILSKFKNYEIRSYDDKPITDTMFSDWFISYYDMVNVYIDNREKEVKKRRYTLIDKTVSVAKKYIKDKWKYSIAPTLEFTTIVPEKGCVVDCVFCPQRTLVDRYKGERRLSLENFKRVIDKLPKEIRVTFSGFVEPWMNSDCTEMVKYAYDQGHPISVLAKLIWTYLRLSSMQVHQMVALLFIFLIKRIEQSILSLKSIWKLLSTLAR